jgi:HD-like signal output (HDOD) protein
MGITAESNTTPPSELHGTAAWVEYLATKSFPVRASSLTRLKNKLISPSTMIKDLNALIKADPILCLSVVKTAQKAHLSAGRDSFVTSIEHAVASLGMDPIEELTDRLKPVKINPSSRQQQFYLRSIANSHLAACYSEAWMRQKNLPFVEETFLSALFYGVGYWSMWLNAPLHMNQVQILMHEKHKNHLQAEQAILGCSVQSIAHGLSKHWELSELILQAQDPETAPSKTILTQMKERNLGTAELSEEEERTLNHIVNDRTFPIKLANWYAQNVHKEWNGPRSSEYADIVCNYLGGNKDDARALLSRTCAQAAHLYHVRGAIAPAAEMLMIPTKKLMPYKLSETEALRLEAHFPNPNGVPLKTTTPPKMEAARVEKAAPKDDPIAKTETRKQPSPPKIIEIDLDEDNKHRVDLLTQRFKEGYSLYTKPSHILGALIQGLHEAVGFEHVCLHLINTKEQTGRCAQALGYEPDDPKTSVTYPLAPSPILAKLLEKPLPVFAKESVRAKYTAALPDELKAVLPNREWALMSIFKGDRPVAFVYVDSTKLPLIPDTLIDQFKLLCHSACTALTNL